MKSITMQQIADELGLNRTTVSFVVNNRARERGIPDTTINRVRSHMHERGYVPSRQALNLKAGSRESVGLLYCTRLYIHVIDAFNRITSIFDDTPGIMEMLTVSRGHLLEGIQELLARGVSKLIWIQTLDHKREFVDPDIIPYLARFERVIFYNYNFDTNDNSNELAGHGFHMVGLDRVKAYGEMARFLKSMGHTNIAFPNIPEDYPGYRTRFRVFEQEGFTPHMTLPSGIDSSDPEVLAGEMCRGVLNAREKYGVTAAVVNGDEQAGGLMTELLKKGIRIPEDMTVTGWDNMPFAANLRVPLTTMSVPVDAMAKRVKRLLSSDSRQKNHRFFLELVERESHASVSRTA